MTKMALVLASYVALSIVLGPLSFGIFQIRIAEALCVFALSSIDYSFALCLGCMIANSIGVIQGVNTLGFIDVILGSLATLLSCLMMHFFRNILFKNIPIVSFMIPAVLNGLIVGLEMMLVFASGQSFIIFLEYCLQVFIGELLSLMIVGLPLYLRIKKVNSYEE